MSGCLQLLLPFPPLHCPAGYRGRSAVWACLLEEIILIMMVPGGESVGLHDNLRKK